MFRCQRLLTLSGSVRSHRSLVFTDPYPAVLSDYLLGKPGWQRKARALSQVSVLTPPYSSTGKKYETLTDLPQDPGGKGVTMLSQDTLNVPCFWTTPSSSFSIKCCSGDSGLFQNGTFQVSMESTALSDLHLSQVSSSIPHQCICTQKCCPLGSHNHQKATLLDHLEQKNAKKPLQADLSKCLLGKPFRCDSHSTTPKLIHDYAFSIRDSIRSGQHVHRELFHKGSYPFWSSFSASKVWPVDPCQSHAPVQRRCLHQGATAPVRTPPRGAALRECLSADNETRCRRVLEPNMALYEKENAAAKTKEGQRRCAAILVSLCLVEGEPAFLFTLRSSTLKGRHKGDVSFAGGKQDPTDRDVVDTALREAREELGVTVATSSVWGVLKPLRDWSGMMIAPVIANIGPLEALSFRPNPSEVEEIFTISLAHVCNPENRGYTHFRTGDRYGYTLPVFRNGKHRVWGLTAVALDHTLKIIVPP
ncbi:hypothetical protein MATL_G00117720 [Megalops atlanticus]|uniref:Nudix hydrolase domain-containing protein n=1 Tax=Megalops atlanticus TaxID=7932 RepID=A0A9D3T824_MEGAT|nr:hypothetical protein MATL_G00117720 [Megalops atlanticus]